MTALDLDAIKARFENAARLNELCERGGVFLDTAYHAILATGADVPALVAEVERLQNVLTEARRELAGDTGASDFLRILRAVSMIDKGSVALATSDSGSVEPI